MENNNFKISIITVWVLAIGNILLTIVGALAKIQHYEFSQLLLISGLTLFFSTWLIVISDMLKNKIYNKIFWIMTMFTLPHISSIFYLIQRDRLIRLADKFGN